MSFIEKILAILLSISFTIAFFEYIENKTLAAERDAANARVEEVSSLIEQQNKAIDQMKDEETKQISNLILAQKTADTERENYKKKAAELMGANISNDCKAAVEWGGGKGNVIYRCWALNCKA